MRSTEEETVTGVLSPGSLRCGCQGVACLWDKLAVDPLTPNPSYPLLPCSLLQSVASPYVGARVD